MKKTKILLTILCIGLLLTGCGQKIAPQLQDGKEVVATLDGKKFTAEDLYNELKTLNGTQGLVSLIDNFITDKEIDDDEEASEYADALIENYKAEMGDEFNTNLTSAGYKNEQELKDAIIADYNKNKVAEKFIKENFTDKEINNHYKNEILGEMTVRYILIKPDKTDDMTTSETEEAEKNALVEAKEVIKKLNNGEKFEDLAKEHSDDASTASDGGLFKDFIKGDVVEEFWNASIALKDGKYTTAPVKSSYGYFVILRVSQKDKPSLDTVKSDIIDELYNKKIEEDSTAISKAWIEIRKKYNLTIIDSDISEIYNKTIKELK